MLKDGESLRPVESPRNVKERGGEPEIHQI